MDVDTPEPPDLGAATREGIETDISTLPSRLLTERAAGEGRRLYRRPDGSYSLDAPAGEAPAALANYQRMYRDQVDAGNYGDKPPSFDQWLDQAAGNARDNPQVAADVRSIRDFYSAGGGDLAADFTGVGDQDRIDRDIANQTRLLEAGAGVARNMERGRLEDLQALLPEFNRLNLEQQRAAYGTALDAADEGERRRLGLELEYRPQFTESNITAQEEAYRRALGAWREENPEASAAKQRLVQELMAGVGEGGELTAPQRRRVEQNVRGAQAARGNILGDAAGFDEALAVSGYGEDLQRGRRAELMGFLQGEQGMTPNFGSGAYAPNMPAFAATTAGGPNLTPANLTQSSAWNVTNPNAGAMGVAQANTRFDQGMQIANQPNPWLEGLGMVGGAALGAMV